MTGTYPLLGSVHLLACRGADPSMVGAIIFQKKIKGGHNFLLFLNGGAIIFVKKKNVSLFFTGVTFFG